MEPITGVQWPVADGRAEWGLAVEDGIVHLLERIAGVWRSTRSWVAPRTAFRDWIKSVLVPDLNGELKSRYGVTPTVPGASQPAEGLVEALGAAVSYNYTARVFAYIAPPDPNNV